MNDDEATVDDGKAGVRERILDAAVEILRNRGVTELSQVQVAREAGIRQSHLTYYFPRRHHLIEATAERIVGEIVHGARQALSGTGEDDVPVMIAALSGAISEREHMRMFVGAIVEADRDPDVRGILIRVTERLEAALADVLGGKDAPRRARFILTTLWGVGLYSFLAGKQMPVDAVRLAQAASTDSG